MGHSVTPKYRLEVVELDVNGGENEFTVAWKGKATIKGLENWIFDYVKSLKPGGCNEHVSRKLGYVPVPHEAYIVEQKTNETIIEWKHPPFLCI